LKGISDNEVVDDCDWGRLAWQGETLFGTILGGRGKDSIRPEAARPADDTGTIAAPSRDTAHGYRPALDGIRAVAVLSVIAYHFGYRWAPGGFLESMSSSFCRGT